MEAGLPTLFNVSRGADRLRCAAHPGVAGVGVPGELHHCGGRQPLADLERVDGVVGGDLLDRLSATDRLHGDHGLELGTVGAALAHR